MHLYKIPWFLSKGVVHSRYFVAMTKWTSCSSLEVIFRLSCFSILSSIHLFTRSSLFAMLKTATTKYKAFNRHSMTLMSRQWSYPFIRVPLLLVTKARLIWILRTYFSKVTEVKNAILDADARSLLLSVHHSRVEGWECARTCAWR